MDLFSWFTTSKILPGLIFANQWFCMFLWYRFSQKRKKFDAKFNLAKINPIKVVKTNNVVITAKGFAYSSEMRINKSRSQSKSFNTSFITAQQRIDNAFLDENWFLKSVLILAGTNFGGFGKSAKWNPRQN